MKIRIILLFGFSFLLSEQILASNIISFPDTTGRKKVFAKEQAFLTQYGTDEVSKAVIRKFFSNRRFHRKLIISFLTVAAISAAGIWIAEESGYALLGQLVGGLALFISGLVFLITLGLYPFHSKKRLLKILENYHATGKLPRRYRSILSGGKESRPSLL